MNSSNKTNSENGVLERGVNRSHAVRATEKARREEEAAGARENGQEEQQEGHRRARRGSGTVCRFFCALLCVMCERFLIAIFNSQFHVATSVVEFVDRHTGRGGPGRRRGRKSELV